MGAGFFNTNQKNGGHSILTARKGSRGKHINGKYKDDPESKEKKQGGAKNFGGGAPLVQGRRGNNHKGSKSLSLGIKKEAAEKAFPHRESEGTMKNKKGASATGPGQRAKICGKRCPKPSNQLP